MWTRGIRGAALLSCSAVMAGGLVTAGPLPAQALETCQSSTSGTSSSVTVCVPDTTLTGVVQVTADVVGTVTSAGVQFSWSGGYLLTDHDAGYAMALDSRRLTNGPVTLTARATTTGGVVTASIQVSASNPSAPPSPASFAVHGAAAGPDGRVKVAAVGDGVDGSPASLAVADRIAAWAPDVFAYLGDVYDKGSPAEFDTWYADAAPAGYGQFHDVTNPTVGNHEYMLPPNDAAAYFAYWGGVPHYYSYDLAGWHVVVLDSTTEFNQLVPGTAQYDWLVADLAAHHGSCMLTYLHHPRYTNVVGVNRDGLSQVWSLLVDSGVAMVLGGHAHTYEHWQPMDRDGAVAAGGMTQFVVGTGGREIINPKGTDPRVAFEVTTPGALRLRLGMQDATFDFVDSAGAVRESGTVPCRQPTPPPPPPPPPDVTAPTVPAGVTARATSPTTATVSWVASADDRGVAGYTVRRGGTVVATVDGASTSYQDVGLRGGTAYGWTVDAVDAAGNRSAASGPATATTPFPTVSSRTLLRQLRRAAEHRVGFTAARFPGWTDADGDRCSTFAEVLITEAARPPAVGTRCELTGGRWLSPYDGKSRTSTSRLVVDHLVPLTEAWQSGAHAWPRLARRQHANDLGYPSTLIAITRAAATAKAAREPPDWLPRPSYRCAYTVQWVAVKWRWRLSVDPAERRFLVQRLTACGWPSVRVPGRAR